MKQIQLSVEESLKYAQTTAYWDGFAAGAHYIAEHAKELAMRAMLEDKSDKREAHRTGMAEGE